MLKIFISLLLAISPLLSFASDNQQRIYTINRFDKGLNSHISDTLTQDNYAAELDNVRVNDSYGSLSKRLPLLTEWDAGDYAVNGLHRYYKSDGSSFAIMATSTYLDIGNSGASTTTHIGQGFSDGKKWQFVTFKDVVIGTNGYDQPIKWDGKTTSTDNADGSRTAGDMVTQLGAPFAELNTGSNLTSSKWYQYKMKFLVAGVTYYSDARSNPILTGSSVKDIYLTNIPIGPVGTTARYIYRTTGDSSRANVLADTTFKLVATISDNTTTVYADTMSDATWAGQTAWSTAGDYSCLPPIAKYETIHKERLWVGGNSTHQSDVYYSDDGNPDFFDPNAYKIIRADDGDQIAFLKTFLGILTVGKTNSIQKIYTDGDETDNWYTSDAFSFVGCYAPYSVDVSPLGIIYFGPGGIYIFNGQQSKLISDAVTKQTRDISPVNYEDMVGIYFNNEYRLSYTSYQSGESYNNRVLLYDFIRDAYVIDTENVSSWEAFDSGTDGGVLYSGNSIDGKIQSHNAYEPVLSLIYKSEIDAGTFDDTATFGEENTPRLSLAWDCTIDTWLTELQTKDASISTLDDIGTYLPNATIDRPDTDGTWTSPIYNISAGQLDKLFWNESLNTYGDITWQIRTGSTSAACAAAVWSSAVSDPNGSDISAVTANQYIQLRANLSTTNINTTPELYKANSFIVRLFYYKSENSIESAIQSVYSTGWNDFGVPGYRKIIEKIKVYYEGSAGTLNFNIKGDDGDVDSTFTINMATSANLSYKDEYTASGDTKMFTYLPPINNSSNASLISTSFKFDIRDNGLDLWKIRAIQIFYRIEEMYP